MWLAILYLPFLALSPILVVVAVVFVVIPGGFIIVLGGAYFLSVELVGLVGLAAARRWRTTHTNRRRANARRGLAQPADAYRPVARRAYR